MTVTRDAVAARKPFSDKPLGGTVEERLGRLPEVVAALRRDDPAAERDRVLQYEAVESIRRTGRTRPPGAHRVRRSRRQGTRRAVRPSFRSAAAVRMWRRLFGLTSGSPSGCSATGQRGRSARSGFHVCTPASSSATRSPMRPARPRRARTPRCCPTPHGVLRLNGYKFYSTGTLFADVIAVSALDARGSRRTGDHSGGPARRRIVRRLGRIRPAHHRQRRHSIHRRRGASPTSWSPYPRATPWATRPLSCSCIWRRWRWASPTPCSTTPSNTCARRPGPLHIPWPTARPPIRSYWRPSGRSLPRRHRPKPSC